MASPAISPWEGWARFFELLRQLPDFAIHIVIGRKKLDAFNCKHNNSPTEFYFDLLHHLLKDCLHKLDQTYQSRAEFSP